MLQLDIGNRLPHRIVNAVDQTAQPQPRIGAVHAIFGGHGLPNLVLRAIGHRAVLHKRTPSANRERSRERCLRIPIAHEPLHAGHDDHALILQLAGECTDLDGIPQVDDGATAHGHDIHAVIVLAEQGDHMELAVGTTRVQLGGTEHWYRVVTLRHAILVGRQHETVILKLRERRIGHVGLVLRVDRGKLPRSRKNAEAGNDQADHGKQYGKALHIRLLESRVDGTRRNAVGREEEEPNQDCRQNCLDDEPGKKR